MSSFQNIQNAGSFGGGRGISVFKAKTSRSDGTGNMSSRKSRRAKSVARKSRRAKGRAGLTIQLDSEKPMPKF